MTRKRRVHEATMLTMLTMLTKNTNMVLRGLRVIVGIVISRRP